MCGPATIDTYGGVFTDEQPVANPTVEQSAAFGTRQMENNAQMTRTSVKAWATFPTIAAAAPQTPVATAGRSQMGVAGGNLPTIAKTATGRYTVTYPASWVDALGVTENIGFLCAGGTVQHLTTFGTVQCTVSASVINVAIFDAAGAATDLGGGVSVMVQGF